MSKVKWKPKGDINKLEKKITHIFNEYFPQLNNTLKEIKSASNKDNLYNYDFSSFENFIETYKDHLSISFTLSSEEENKVIKDITLELKLPERSEDKNKKLSDIYCNSELFLG